ncbi:hypothetical protein RB195_009650 [Necator americanus]|uniref:DUF7083 domain-containing protein n=1 Tax=Necator americanus TaxID=51031 RepID=A0ABR1CU96_NECAM
MFVSDEEVGHTFAYWYKRYGPVIKDSVLLDSKKRDLILTLDEDAYRKYADDILPKQPHEIDFETTVANLEKLFTSKKALIRQRDGTTGKNILGNGTCNVTEGTNLLGLEWCIQLPAYKELKDKYHCRMVTKEEANREEIIADLKKQYAEVFKCGLGRCVKTKAKLLLKDNAVPVFKK